MLESIHLWASKEWKKEETPESFFKYVSPHTNPQILSSFLLVNYNLQTNNKRKIQEISN